MTDTWRMLFLITIGIWLGVVAVGMTSRGRALPWPAVMARLAAVDLAGVWAGTFAAICLFAGRRGYGGAWASALGLIALMVTAALYHRAVLLPSMDSAWKRMQAGVDRQKWEGEWRFLWRMAGWTQTLILMAGGASAVCIAAFAA